MFEYEYVKNMPNHAKFEYLMHEHNAIYNITDNQISKKINNDQ